MRFDFKAYRAGEGVIRLSLDAPDLDAARQQAETQGYTVLSAQAGQAILSSPLGAFGKRLGPRFSVPLFGQELLALLDAGMGLVEAVAILARKSRQPESRQVLERIHRMLGEGRTFSRALEAAPDTFSALFVATVKASERTGNVTEALRRYLAYHRQLNALRDKITAAAVYPALLILVGGLVVLFLLGYVVPRFSKVYQDIGADRLPALSRWLMEWGQLAADHTVLLATGFFALLALAAYALSRPATRAAVERRLWRLPLVGEQLRVYQLARFTRTVAMLQKGGIPLVSALDMTDALLRQPALQAGLTAAKTALREGRPVSDTFGRYGLATEVGTRLLMVGERSGELGETMERIAAFYDEDIARSVEWLSRLFEPALMIFIGLLIGGIVILMYLPIFELASSIQ
ncbi:MAG: type II secretion system F family protein [Rhodocyclaceae bacterium]|nr:MAG: type II secretion system F family protein [Rhodocyclaceae bacterium]